jgi:D-xylose transport system permease protein
MDGNFALLGGGPNGSLGEIGSWIVGALGCVAIILTVLSNRRRRHAYGFAVRPMWALATVIVASCAAVLGAVWIANSYLWPDALAHQYALSHNIPEPPCAISGAVQTARLNSAVTNLGVQNELDVISAAVIGGSSLSGGIGTIPGAVLGAVVMQSLRSGMVMLRVDSPTQDIVVGIVLVAAVGLDAFLRRRKK